MHGKGMGYYKLAHLAARLQSMHEALAEGREVLQSNIRCRHHHTAFKSAHATLNGSLRSATSRSSHLMVPVAAWST
eukprot:16689-Heterococcus_DN1.PRE.8